MTAAVTLGVLLLAGLFAEAVWEKRGRPMPHVSELELPLRGRAALGMGIALVLTALTIIVFDITIMVLTS
jgi:hypothetical protein